MEHLEDDEVDEILRAPLRSEHEWTEHLARQLGFRTLSGAAGIHDTLLLIIPELDRLIRTWPPSHNIGACRVLAHEATKHLSPVEVYATLLAGPSQWGQARLDVGCRVESLATHMQPVLEKGLAAELNRVLDKWVEWDIRALRERPGRALKASEAESNAQPAAPRVPFQKPSGRERRERYRPPYRPPGRT